MTILPIFLACLAGIVFAKPINNADQLDKATVNDVSANTVSPDKNKIDSTFEINEKKEGASVQITGITTGAELPINEPPFKPQRAGSMFARLIDDIFAIPITVLQNVAKLITNPFVQQKKVQEPAI